MLTALVLLLAVGPPELVRVGRCNWERPAASTARPNQPTGKVQPHRKKRTASPTPPKPGDEFIGCDEDGPVWRSDITTVEFWPPEAPPVKLDRIEPVPAMPAEPLTFETECDCGPAFPYWPPIFIGGGGSIVYQLTAIPEPSTWLMLLAGLALIIRRRTA